MTRTSHVGPHGEAVITAALEDGRVLRVVGLPPKARQTHMASEEMTKNLQWEILNAGRMALEAPTRSRPRPRLERRR